MKSNQEQLQHHLKFTITLIVKSSLKLLRKYFYDIGLAQILPTQHQARLCPHLP